MTALRRLWCWVVFAVRCHPVAVGVYMAHYAAGWRIPPITQAIYARCGKEQPR